jgi:hypothetical protein
MRLNSSAWAAAAVAAAVGSLLAGQDPLAQVRMSVHNRLLWNRAVVREAPRLEVLLLTDPASTDRVAAAAEKIDGRIGKQDRRIGYLRVDLPTAKLIDLISDPQIDAWHIASASRMAWYRDGPPVASASMYRGFEVLAPPRSAPSRPIDKPALTADAARAAGYTADEDSGLGEWRRRHPPFDGRGVTIANIEDGLLDFGHPAFRSSLTLDGREVPKIAGIVNAIDLDSHDRTRVVLDTDVRVTSSWTRVGSRTFVFPRPGTYHFGIFSLATGGNLVQQFGVAEDEAGELRVDADGDGDFRNEQPISDVNDRYDVRALIVRPPPDLRLPFVVARGKSPRTVHVYAALGSHVTMTASVAAGSRNADSVSTGVAPNARILLVRVGEGLREYVEAYLAVGRRDDVDVISDSNGVSLLPQTDADFIGRFLTRFGEAYNKIILHSANNTQLILNSASTPGSALSIGGTMSPGTFSALFGGRLDEVVVHPAGAAGPGLDGSIRPDVIAPFHVISADLQSKDNGIGLPSTAPATRLPAGYQISCCTSASAPYAAGLAALLISAAKQAKAAYSRDALSRAIRFGARFLDTAPAHQQGNGVFDVNAAWRELNRPTQELVVHATSTIGHPLAPYAASGTAGSGLLEREGWRTGLSARRSLTFLRQSGPAAPTTYRITWTGNDGTFVAPSAITLPLNAPVGVPIDIGPRAPGAHSALLNLHDPSSGEIVFRTQATIVAAHEFDPRTHNATVGGTIATMRERSEYFRVPESASALTIRLRTMRGRVRAFLVPAHGVYPSYYWHQHPLMTPPVAAGTHVITLTRPQPGVWTVSLINDATRRENVASPDPIDFSLDVSIPGASLTATRGKNGAFDVDIRDVLQTTAEPLLSSALGTLTSARAELSKDGLPGLIDIDVPAGTGMLLLHARSANGLPLDAHLYDCTTGECFSHTFTMPARAEQSIAVRRPTAGRWVLAVNSAPIANASMKVAVDTILTGETRSVALPGSIEVGAKRRASVLTGAIPPPPPGARRIVLFELFDGAMARDEVDHPWESRPNVERLADRPVAIATHVWSDERRR